MPFKISKLLPHLLILLGFVLVSLVYFYPVMQGKTIYQSDIVHFIGMAEQQKEFKQETGRETYWTNSAFGGMPTYQLGAGYAHNYIKKLDSFLRFLPRPADYLFLYLVGMYVLLLVLKMEYKLAALGALVFGFSTYLIIILGVGHNSKAHAIAFMPLVVAGILLVFQKKYIWGFILFTLSMGLELQANHFQMTYYLFFLGLIISIIYVIDYFKRKEFKGLLKPIGILIVASAFSVGLNAENFLATQEYAKYTIRGPSELTQNSDGTNKPITNGLDKDYITEYSYGLWETLNLYIPRFMGGGSGEKMGKESETYNALVNMGTSPIDALEQTKHLPMYWGDQPIVEAPAYIGAIVVFLFILGLFLVKGKLKWWLVTASIFSLILSYGKTAPFSFITYFFIDYIPLYSKFRAVSSIQVILELCVPVLGILGLRKLISNEITLSVKLNALKKAGLIAAGLPILFLLFSGVLPGLDFVGVNDGYYRQNMGLEFVTALQEDRKSLFIFDNLRTLFLVIMAFGVLCFFLKNKVSKNQLIVVLLVLGFFDLFLVNKQYVDESDFVRKNQMYKPYKIRTIDKEILKDKSVFRVWDVSNTGQRMPARASFYHQSISGYSAAKLRHFSNLFDFHIAKNNPAVLNMLNVKYIVYSAENNLDTAYLNEDALGNAWFIDKLNEVESADQAIQSLDSLNTQNMAVIQKVNAVGLNAYEFKKDSLQQINLVSHTPDYIKYQSESLANGFAVFSEVFYPHGWNAYIDGEKALIRRVNYVLRGLEIPKGNHTIEFKFEPEVVTNGGYIALASSIVFGFMALGLLFVQIRNSQ